MAGKYFKRWREYRFALGAGLVALLYAVLSETGALQGSHPLVGGEAPTFSLELLDGGTVDLAGHRGTDVVVLDFWSTSCPPCRKGLPLLEKVTAEFDGQPVAAYGVAVMDSPGVIRAFLTDAGISLPVGVDDYGDLAELYGVRGIPHTVVVGKDGKVRDVHVGVGGFEGWLRKAIQAGLDAPQVS